MRYMLLVRGAPADSTMAGAMSSLARELRKAGVLLGLDALRPPSTGARISFVNGRPTVMDNPIGEERDTLGGLLVIQVRTREEAIEWARRAPGLDQQTIEVRELS